MRVNWYSSCSRKEQEQNTGSLACPLWPGSFSGVRVGADPWSGLRAGFGGLPTPLVVLCAGVMPNPALLLSPQKQQYISVFFCVSLFITARTAQCLQIFLVCYRLYSVAQGDICPGAKCKHSSTGSLALACLSLKWFM